MPPTEWFVVCKTGQIVHDFVMTTPNNVKPDLTLYYEFPELYEAIIDPSALQLDAYRKSWWRTGTSAVGIQTEERGERREILGS